MLEVINIIDFGAVGDGLTDDTKAIQMAIDAVQDKGGGCVLVPSGIFKFSEVNITRPYVEINGFGKLLNGRIIVGNDILPMDLYFKIKNIEIRCDSLVEGTTGIEIQNARIGQVKEVTFRNIDKPLYFRPIASEYYHQSEKIKMEENTFKNCNYCLYVDRPESPTQQYQVGDITFSRNYAFGDIYKKHAHILGVDGLKFDDNVLFFPGHDKRNQTKEQNLYIDYGNFIGISGNQFFEAGYEGIILSRCRNFTISNNRIPWSGQRQPSDAIRITGGDQNGEIYNVGTIAVNQIERSTRHGVSIEGNCGYITVGAGNTMRDIGSSYGYYGETDLNSIEHYAVTCDMTCQFVFVQGNNCPNNSFRLLGGNNVAINNLEAGRVLRNSYYILSLQGTETSAAVGKYDGIDLAQAAPTTINSFSGGFDGKEITCLSYNGNTTFAHGLGSAQFCLKNRVNATLPAHGTITFKFLSSRWYEISRNF
ncbi:glycosyl hydrolase family 28-related protein [Paenibacillus terreus]|uniref:Glycosyl hydrolase family 28-related protein n=1 Tax=Paenibacillus terreus TaxID=1387834 RepID=A0ABV5B528_9BACL